MTLLLTNSSEGGGDLLFKILLHSNLPGQYNFGRNSKCNWRIKVLSRREEEDQEEGEDQEREVEIGIGGEEQFSRIKEFFLTKRGGGGGRGGERKKESSSTSSFSSQPPIITTPSSPLPIPETSTPTTGDATSSSSSNNKKKKKSGKTTTTTTSSLKELDLLGSSLESSPTSSSPLQQQLGRTPSPLRNADTEEEQEKEKGKVIEMVETKPMILDRTAYASTNGTSRDVNHDRAEVRTTGE